MQNLHEENCETHCVHEIAVKKALETLPDDDKIITMADMFKLLADTSRLKIVIALLDNELCVCDICNIIGMSQSAISHQLRVLRADRLVKYRKAGKQVFYSIDDSHVSDIIKLAETHLSHAGD